MPYRPLLPPEKVGASNHPNQKYHLDERGRKLIMDLYDGSKERTDLLQRYLPGVPRRIIQRWACELGKVHSRQYWSPEQEQFLRENYNKLSMRKLQNHLKKYHVTIMKKIQEMGLIREDKNDGYTIADLMSIFGVNHNSVKKWIEKGWLKGKKTTTAFQHDIWRFSLNTVRKFILSHPDQLNPHKFDWIAIADILAGENGLGRLDEEKYTRKEEEE